MIPNEASCPVFSFTFRRKSVVELRMSGRKEKIKKKEKKRKRARIFLLLPSFFFSSLHFCLFAVCIAAFSGFVPRRQSWFSINLASCKMRVILEKKKKKRKDACGSARNVRVHGRPNANVCTFHTFPKSSQEKDVCDFCTCYALWRNGKKMERKDAKRW